MVENAAVSKNSLIQNQAVRLREISPGAFAVVIDNPPVNLVTQEVFAGLTAVKSFAEESPHDVRVLVFESANPEFFVSHVDLNVDLEAFNDPRPGSGMSEPSDIVQQWPAFSYWLGTAPVVSIAVLRGRARGFGYEFAASMDMRFASLENTQLCLPEVGFGGFPGGGGLEWAQIHAGRARAMEFVLSSDDFDADTAERYGLVNRSIPQAELDDYVYRLARRIASFNPAAIAMVKSYLTQRRPIPLPEELAETSDAAMGLQSSDAAQVIITRIISKAGGIPFDYAAELDLPKLCDAD
ncbi:MAG TPA: enoyl-CoA hydratase/isomerase family protein [Streptosporangiaceae bacterium]|nr:enoyl-CoA hydratase/isomerase family protein [Streptosporangiaceae bacterium]